MNSHNKDFALYFKGRENSILARGETENYINDYPKDLYIYDYKTKTSSPLISYDWFPSHAKYYLEQYDFPVFPDDFAYYLLKDNKTLVMISAVKSLNANFKFDILEKKLDYNQPLVNLILSFLLLLKIVVILNLKIIINVITINL